MDQTSDMKSLVLYFSRADENYFGGQYRYITKGNTEVIAEMIAQETGADLFKIEPVKPYPKVYNDCIEIAQKEKNANARPPVKTMPDISQYDTIYLGYPIYWGTFPMHVFTVLESLNTAGKTIKPFCTHEGSGVGESIGDLRRICDKATIRPALAISGSSVGSATSKVKRWIQN